MKVYDNGVATLYQADARDLPIPDASVHCVVTSPPYWGLRDYGLGDWDGGDEQCDHMPFATLHASKPDDYFGLVELLSRTVSWPRSTFTGKDCGAVKQPAGIGLEPTLAEHIENIVDVGRELWRVMRDDATWFLNYGDAYASIWLPALTNDGHFGTPARKANG